MRFYRHILIVPIMLAGLSSAGCAEMGKAIGRPVAPQTPNTAEITGYVKETSAMIGTDTTTYVKAGYALVDQNCHEFFDALYQAKTNERFVRSETILGLGTSSAAIAAATKAAKTLAYIAIGTNFISATFDNFEAWSYLSLYQAHLKSHVDEALGKYRAANPDTSAAGDTILADQLVKNYAYLCTPMAMDMYIQNSLSNSKPALTTTAGSATVQITSKPKTEK